MINLKNNNGTILIWTVLLGVAMTSVFFFLAIRLGGLGGIQRESIEYQNQKAYLQSYVDYLMANPGEMDGTFDNIKVKLSNKVDEIVGVLDAGGMEEYKISGKIKIEWNKCEESLQVEFGQLNTDPLYTGGPATQDCSSFDYHDYVVRTPTAPPELLKIESLDTPFNYRITPVGSTELTDNFWHLKASIDLGYGKKIEMEEVF